MLIKKLFGYSLLLISILGLTTSTTFAEQIETERVCSFPNTLDGNVNIWISVHKKCEVIDIKFGEEYQDKNLKRQCAFIIYKNHQY